MAQIRQNVPTAAQFAVAPNSGAQFTSAPSSGAQFEPGDDARPRLSLMIRPWAPAAVNEHARLALGDAECPAHSVVWVEISYGLEDAPLTYLRHPLQLADWRCAEPIAQLLNGESHYITWRSGCPPALLLARPGPADAQGDPTFQMTLQLHLSGLTDRGPRDASAITFALDQISGDELLRFGEAFDHELRQALNSAPSSGAQFTSAPNGGAQPTNAPNVDGVSVAAQDAGQPSATELVPPALHVNAFSSRINAAAYDALGADYTHDYLDEPFFRQAFDSWLAQLPAHSRVLEIGCGHGRPIAAALTADGQRVTGIDPSAAMIAQARHSIPDRDFRQMALAELNELHDFDGACSFFSLLCMDPIELRIGLERLHRALKPDAPLLIVSGVPDLFTRTSPLRTVQGRTTWEWSYDHEDMAAVLTERAQWHVGAADLRYYDADTLKRIELNDLDRAAADIRHLTVKGVYALSARRV